MSSVASATLKAGGNFMYHAPRRFPSLGATIGLLALVVLLIWLVAGLLVLLGWMLGLIG
jgi:hypothetical protein